MSDCLDHFTTTASFVSCRSLFFMKIHKGNKIAIIWGVDGDFGRHLLERLLLNPAYHQVKIFSEQEINLDHEKLIKTNLSKIDIFNNSEIILGDDLFICPKKYSITSSKRTYYHQNFMLPTKIAKKGLENGINQVFCLSNQAASEQSPLFQMRVLGALEYEILKMEFWSTHFFKPIFLTKNKTGQGVGGKLLDKFDQAINRISKGAFHKIAPTSFSIISTAMITAAQELESGVFHHHSDSLKEQEPQTDKTK